MLTENVLFVCGFTIGSFHLVEEFDIIIFLQVSSIDDLEDGKEYVVSGKGELFKKIEYTKTDTLRPKRLSNTKFSIHSMINNVPKVVVPDCIRPRIVTIIRNGIKPRKVRINYMNV